MIIKMRYGIILSLLGLLAFSGFTAAAQPAGCPVGQGFWKNTAQWPVTSLTLGGQTYSQAELLILLNLEVQGDASLNLAHALITAKLNAANGADVTAVSGIIAQADALLATFPDKLPYTVDPSSANGQTMVSLAGVLDIYNSGQLTPGCAPVATATPIPTATLTPTPTPTGTLTVTPPSTDDDGDIVIVIEGPVQAININIITIYNINIEVNPNDPILTIIQIGDVIRVAGSVVNRGTTIVIVAVNIIIVDVDIVVIDNSVIWRDDGSCRNPPPAWAPANGWRRRCEPGGSRGRGRGNDRSGSRS